MYLRERAVYHRLLDRVQSEPQDARIFIYDHESGIVFEPEGAVIHAKVDVTDYEAARQALITRLGRPVDNLVIYAGDPALPVAA
jgi:NAD(P)-dependent dehydrogenase (short-subunit alcohol dehydrogenase family)